MKFAVVVFPGSNCDRDMIDCLQNDLKQTVIPLWHKDNDISMLSKEDCIVLPGGFSYGDYLRCGAIAQFSPMMKEVIKFAKEGGKVLGVCNGFQILCEAGLLAGALLGNENQEFVCKNIFIKDDKGQDIYKVPVAHGEGRYYADDATLTDLKENNQILFTYCTEDGEITEEANPNGAIQNIAGIKNKSGNIIGMMPHPERAGNQYVGNEDGIKIFNLLFGISVN